MSFSHKIFIFYYKTINMWNYSSNHIKHNWTALQCIIENNKYNNPMSGWPPMIHKLYQLWNLILNPSWECSDPGVDPGNSGQTTLVSRGDDPYLHPPCGVLLLIDQASPAVPLAGVPPALLAARAHHSLVNLHGRRLCHSCLCSTYVVMSWVPVPVPFLAYRIGNNGELGEHQNLK